MSPGGGLAWCAGFLPGEKQRDPTGSSWPALLQPVSVQAPVYLQGSAAVCGTDSVLPEALRYPETPQLPTRGSPFSPTKTAFLGS